MTKVLHPSLRAFSDAITVFMPLDSEIRNDAHALLMEDIACIVNGNSKPAHPTAGKEFYRNVISYADAIAIYSHIALNEARRRHTLKVLYTLENFVHQKIMGDNMLTDFNPDLQKLADKYFTAMLNDPGTSTGNAADDTSED